MIAATHARTVDREVARAYPGRSTVKAERIPVEIDYPDSDGKPMGETEFHVIAILHLYAALQEFFSNRDDVYLAADMFLYYEEGNRYANKSPDIMVIKGVPKHKRRTFKVWEERAHPCVIFEMTSKTTAAADIAKCSLYARLGVREYFLFDPLREYLEQGLLGFRLEQGEYVEILPDGDGRLFSEELELFLYQEEELLRAIQPQANQPLPSFPDAMRLARQEAQRAEQEAQKAEQEAQRAKRLAEQLRALGIEPEN